MKAPGSVLRKALPRATWVESVHKHRTIDRTDFRWLCVDNDEDNSDHALSTFSADLDVRLYPLLRAVMAHRHVPPHFLTALETTTTEDTSLSGEPLSCIVFCKSLRRAETLFGVLQSTLGSGATNDDDDDDGGDGEFDVVRFHRNVPVEERLQTLEEWRGVRQCTLHCIMPCDGSFACVVPCPCVTIHPLHVEFVGTTIYRTRRAWKPHRLQWQQQTVVVANTASWCAQTWLLEAWTFPTSMWFCTQILLHR